MGYTLTSEVKARERGMCTLATNLRGITRNTGILCQNIRGNVVFLSSTQRGQNKHQEGTDHSNQGGLKHQESGDSIYCCFYFSFQSFWHLGHITPQAAFHACGSS